MTQPCSHEHADIDWQTNYCKCGKSVELIINESHYGRSWPVACGYQTMDQFLEEPMLEMPKDCATQIAERGKG